MPQIGYTATIDVPRQVVWDFVRDMNNWAPFARGYESHDVIDDRESLWTIKGDIGPISRVTKFQVEITQWEEGELVAFTLKGLNEPITGEGAIRLVDSAVGGGTDIRADAGFEFGGSLGPIVSPLIGPWIKSGADELVTKIAVALQPTYTKPEQPLFIVRWLKNIWQLLRSILGGGAETERVQVASATSGDGAPAAAGSVSVAPAAETTASATKPRLSVETLLVGPSLEQYSGGGAGMMELDTIASSARGLEELGFDGVTTPEAGHDPFLPLMVAAEHTNRVTLGTNVAIAFPRSPMVVAQIAWDLQRFSQGRFKLGLGTQVKGHNERRYATPWPSPPGPRLREYLLCLKAMFRSFQEGERPDFTGEHYRFTLMSPFFNPGPIEHPDVPIYISALNTYMARLAGELCDGVRLHPLGSADFTKAVVVPAMEAGASKAGRQLSDVDIVGSPFIVTGKDKAAVDAARGGVKQQIAFYSSTRTYHSVLEHHGWGEVGRTLHALSIEGKWQEMGEQISDEILEAFATVATYDELVPMLTERWGGICDTIFLGLPPPLLSDEALMREIVDGLHRA